VFTSVTSDPIKVPEGRINRFILDRFSFEKGLAVGGTLFAIGALYAIYLTYNWYSSGFTAVPHINQSIAAFTGIFTGIQTVFYSMFLSIILGEDQTG
jgi:hypothetical protein